MPDSNTPSPSPAPSVDSWTLQTVTWAAAEPQLRLIRETVFVAEQGVPAAIEIDGRDPECVHVLVSTPDGAPIATGRLLPDGRIGRMAVLPTWRGRGIGAAMLRHLVTAAAAAGHAEVYLHAQAHAESFYLAGGFHRNGEPFTEAGIPHVHMLRTLA